jgi:hypothetical protein
MIKRWLMPYMPAVLLCAILGCAGLGLSQAAGTPFQGRIVHNDFEGGFYGIVTREGKRLDPLQLPEGLKRKGLLVRGRYRLKEGIATTHMWGSPVEILEIQPVQESGWE